MPVFKVANNKCGKKNPNQMFRRQFLKIEIKVSQKWQLVWHFCDNISTVLYAGTECLYRNTVYALTALDQIFRQVCVLQIWTRFCVVQWERRAASRYIIPYPQPVRSNRIWGFSFWQAGHVDMRVPLIFQTKKVLIQWNTMINCW